MVQTLCGDQYRYRYNQEICSGILFLFAGMFVAAAIKELRQCVLPTMVFLVSHYTMVAISQQAGQSVTQ